MLTSLLKALKDELVTPEDMMGLQNDVFAMVSLISKSLAEQITV